VEKHDWRYSSAMRITIIAPFLLLACSTAPTTGEGEGEQSSEGEGEGSGFEDLDGTFALEGGGRAEEVVLPDSYDGQTALPLVLLLHGIGVTGPQMEAYTSFRAFANSNDLLYIAPTGTLLQGSPYWNAFSAGAPDDSTYLAGLVAEAKLGLNVDATQVFVVGHSNGSFMAHQLACEHGDVFSGIVAVAGPVQPNRCVPTEPVAVLHVHGTADATVAYQGGNISGIPYIGAEATTTFWADANDCGAEPAAAEAHDYIGATAGSETEVFRYEGCTGRGAVERWTMQGVGHAPFFNAAFFADMLTFVRANPRSGG
jgi:polyhydroxybutyrate depolymerase